MSRPYPRAALSVFRQVLRIHRDNLPPPMRTLGDNYIRDEMRRHNTPDTTKAQWQTFVKEWCIYRDMLTGKGDLQNKGGDIHPDVIAAMTPEQKQQFLDLKQETEKLASVLGVPQTKPPA